ncbi:MAG: protein translocase subunit SecD [Paenibacillaceae bacterium]
MDFKRFGSFLLIVILGLGLIAWTTPNLLKGVRLGLDLKGGFEVLYIVEPIDETQELTHDVLIEAARSIEDRANKNGAEEPEVTPEGSDRIRVKIAGVTDPVKIRETLKEPANLTFRSSDGTIELRGNDFVENAASVQFDGTTQAPIISIELKDKDKFYEITQRISQKPNQEDRVLEIWLNEERLTSPSVSQGINSDKAVIEGYSLAEARDYAAKINLGALPVKLTEKYAQVVDATLGKAALDKTVMAGLIGCLLVLISMIAIYRVPGIVASFTIVSFIWLLLFFFHWMNATLTLPGIAGFVLGIGMAVDANIITYERIKDELRSGKSMLSAVRSGSSSSLRTVVDANVTTLIAGIVLFYMGSGAIKGFALVLIIGIVVSMFTNVFLSRILLNFLVRGLKLKNVRYFGVKEADVREL